jgi:hypothetical protein
MDHPIRADCHAGSSGAWLRHCAPRGGNVRPGPGRSRGPVPSSRRTAAGNGPNPTASRRRRSPRRRSRGTSIFSSRFWPPLTPSATATGADTHGQGLYHLALCPADGARTRRSHSSAGQSAGLRRSPAAGQVSSAVPASLAGLGSGAVANATVHSSPLKERLLRLLLVPQKDGWCSRHE